MLDQFKSHVRTHINSKFDEMATEIAIFPLRPGKRPDDASSGAGQVLKDTLETLTEQPGFQRAYWGREAENPDTFRLFVDWDSVDAHIEFTKKESVFPKILHECTLTELQLLQTFPRPVRHDRHQRRGQGLPHPLYTTSCR